MIRTVTVLQDDIDNGRPANNENCPIARAIRREWENGDKYFVGRNRIFRKIREEAVTVTSLPVEAREFVHRVDCGFAVEPFKFEIEVPD